MTDLTPRQSRFAESYAACGNATEAARKAGYSLKTATSQGARLLTYANVAARITQLQGDAAARAKVLCHGRYVTLQITVALPVNRLHDTI